MLKYSKQLINYVDTGADPGFSEGGSESIVDLEGWG